MGRRPLILSDTHVAVWHAAGIARKLWTIALIGEAAHRMRDCGGAPMPVSVIDVRSPPRTGYRRAS